MIRERETEDAILDVRPCEMFERLHRVGSVNIPLEELADRIHELPPPETPLAIYDECRVRARWAASRLRARGREFLTIHFEQTWLREGSTRVGPSRDRLWLPHMLLREALIEAASIWESFEGRRALDLACGAGRDAVFLALSGFKTEAWDVLPDALDRCRDLARRSGVTVDARQCDLEADSTGIDGQFDLICVFNYLHRPLIRAIAEAVRPGGLVVYVTFVQPQRELYGKPRRDAFILKSGELPGRFGGWRIVATRESLARPRRFVASLIAQKPTIGSGETRPSGS